MENHVKKLIAVMDSRHLLLYEAQGLKIIKGPTNPELSFPHHTRPEKNHGSYDQAFGYSIAGGPPHTMPKEIDHQNAAKIICDHLDELFIDPSNYKELIIIAEPGMLGYIRENLSGALKKKITKEIHKDLVKESKNAIEETVFGK